jgi:hypothetical protein
MEHIHAALLRRALRAFSFSEFLFQSINTIQRNLNPVKTNNYYNLKMSIMKKVTITLLLLATCGFVRSQNNYETSMKKWIDSLQNAKTADTYKRIANSFDRIATAEKDKWLPYYYAGFSYVMVAFNQEDMSKVDPILDQAQTYVDKAIALKKDEAEIQVLQALLYQARIMADPMSRGMSFSSKASGCLEKAKSLNVDNPRIYYLEGQNLLHTPEMFGGGKSAGCPVLLKAKGKYESFKAESDLWPSWGKSETTELLKNCF